MIKILRLLAVFIAALLLQTTVLPAYLEAPFRPDLLLVIVVYLGLRGSAPGGACLALLAGLVHDCFSGLYLGLYGFAYLCLYLALRLVADYLYADSRYLFALVVFAASFIVGLLQLVLLLIFSAAEGVYASLLPSLLPQALVNTLCASVFALYLPVSVVEEGR